MSTQPTPKSDKELWQSLAAPSRSLTTAASAPSDLDFAAWLEGRLSEEQAAPIEAAIAGDPEMLRAALELSDILGKPLPAAPARMTVRAQALVGFEVERQAQKSSGRNWLAPLAAIFGAGLAFERGAIAGVAIAVAAVGFLMGGGLGNSYAHQKQQATISTYSPFGPDTTNQLNDLFTDNG
jgi:hypothetical protein